MLSVTNMVTVALSTAVTFYMYGHHLEQLLRRRRRRLGDRSEEHLHHHHQGQESEGSSGMEKFLRSSETVLSMIRDASFLSDVNISLAEDISVIVEDDLEPSFSWSPGPEQEPDQHRRYSDLNLWRLTDISRLDSSFLDTSCHQLSSGQKLTAEITAEMTAERTAKKTAEASILDLSCDLQWQSPRGPDGRGTGWHRLGSSLGSSSSDYGSLERETDTETDLDHDSDDGDDGDYDDEAIIDLLEATMQWDWELGLEDTCEDGTRAV